MLRGFLGKKIGMSQIFRDNGESVPVTVIQAGPCAVTQIKSEETDGYNAVQLGFGSTKSLNKPERGHLKNSDPVKHLREVKADNLQDYSIGQQISVDIFDVGEKIDIIGTTKGKGFAGTMKRHGFGGGPRTHGQSDRGRAPGSIGGGTTPGKVYKGLKMSGHKGNEQVTVKNLEIVQIDQDRNLLVVKGGVPGAPNGLLVIRRKG